MKFKLLGDDTLKGIPYSDFNDKLIIPFNEGNLELDQKVLFHSREGSLFLRIHEDKREKDTLYRIEVIKNDKLDDTLYLDIDNSEEEESE